MILFTFLYISSEFSDSDKEEKEDNHESESIDEVKCDTESAKKRRDIVASGKFYFITSSKSLLIFFHTVLYLHKSNLFSQSLKSNLNCF